MLPARPTRRNSDHPDLLPVAEHLRPKPRRNLLATVPADVRKRLPPAFVERLSGERCIVIGRVDRTRHPLGWGYDWIAVVCREWAEAQPFKGQA